MALSDMADLQVFRKSGRQDLNLRPPGPQPGALPDCATPRGCYPEPTPWELSERATGIEPALEAWKAPAQPQPLARKRGSMLLTPPPPFALLSRPLPRLVRQSRRRP